MAGKGAKLTKLKSSVMKKWNSFSKLGRSLSDPSGSQLAAKTSSGSGASSFSSSSDDSGRILRTVYVGKSRRRYLVTSDVMDNPVLRELISSDAEDSDAAAAVVVDCEVVLFEHLLWMLENAVESPPAESLHEFAQYYSCN